MAKAYAVWKCPGCPLRIQGGLELVNSIADLIGTTHPHHVPQSTEAILGSVETTEAVAGSGRNLMGEPLEDGAGVELLPLGPASRRPKRSPRSVTDTPSP